MVMKVLKSSSKISESRSMLNEIGVSHLDLPDSRLKSIARRLGFIKSPVVGDYVKSWDVFLTFNFISQHLNKNQAILDIGSFASEILISLHKFGFKNLTGIDLNEALKKMPHQEAIAYQIQNFMKTNFKDSSFKAITAISVIEHGLDSNQLLKEVARLLEKGGYFIASFDYYEKKIDTFGIKMFGMDWNIFSKDEVVELIKQAEKYGLEPVGDLEFSCEETPIKCAGKNYTFGWLVFKKRD